MQEDWDTAPLPGPDTTGVSLAGGSTLVIFRRSEHKEAAWELIEYLSEPEIQERFYEVSGDLPARREAWEGSLLTADPRIRAFREQLERVTATPKVPEWELIASRLQERTELAVRGQAPPDSALALLDRDVERILEKRRWLLERGRGRAGTTAP
jgi:multiple sugar transport system substrate-binding protein